MNHPSDISVVNNVIVGKDDFLFLSSDDHFTLDFLLGRKSVNPKDVNRFRQNIESRRLTSEVNGAQYLHLVAPDKHVVLRDKFPLTEFVCLGDLYKRQAGVDFVYPVAELRAVAGSYARTDTHWSVHGQIEITRLLAARFRREPAEIDEGVAALRAAVVCENREIAGDLGLKLDPPRTHPLERLRAPWKVHMFSNGVSSGNSGRIVVLISRRPQAKGRLLIFGDSFLGQTLTCLTALFREIVFCRTPHFHPEMFYGCKPDYVVSENVERYLSAVASDTDAPPMLLLASMKERAVTYKPGHARAIAAMLAPESRTYRKFMAALDAADQPTTPAPATSV